MKIALACDHAGLSQAKELQAYLTELGYEVNYYGPESLQAGDDYPKFVSKAAKAVSEGICSFGVVLGGSGQGEAMSANRFRGVRCAVYYGSAVPSRTVDVEGRVSHDVHEIVKLSRQHNDANMLSLAARFVSLDEMKHVLRLWLKTDFSNDPRHLRRIEQLDKEV